MTGVIIVIFFVILALGAPVIAPYEPINPMADVGQLPAIGAGLGRKIAEPLCYPSWYKYMPNVPKGEIVISEEFFNNVTYVPELKKTFQLFGAVGQIARDDVLMLTRRTAMLYNIVATKNGTSVQIPSSDYTIEARDPREIRLNKFYANETIFKVTYSTGVDIVENIKVVQDPIFASQTSLDEWHLVSDYEGFKITYDSTKGFNNDGCLEISSPTGTPPETVYVNLSRAFEYPYWEPVRRVFVHFSYKLEGDQNASISFLFRREDSLNPFMLKTYQLETSKPYAHEVFDSVNPEVKANIGSEHPLDFIFAHPSNYTFLMQITFQKPNANTKLYLDNVHCVLYGNAFGLLGTDNDVRFPRDIFSTLVYGTRVSLLVGVLSAVFSTLIGLFLGLISGYVGGIVDETIMRFADLLLVLPTLPLFIVLIVALRTVKVDISIWNIIIIITFFGWMSFARSVRSMVISLRERAFVEAAKASGAGTMHIINRHILPNVFALVYITLATAVPGAIILEASLSWLGLGNPLIPSWGKVLYDFQNSGIALTKGLAEYWFWVFPACIAIALLATAFILIGYALDEILNPRLRERR
jgi:ABC-type dipeptide/oligopeptide/nickel transport system permease subunit